MLKTQYLGDGVYVKMDNLGMLKLTTDSHLDVDATNIIYLEDFVFDALVQYRDHALAVQEDGDES